MMNLGAQKLSALKVDLKLTFKEIGIAGGGACPQAAEQWCKGRSRPGRQKANSLENWSNGHISPSDWDSPAEAPQ